MCGEGGGGDIRIFTPCSGACRKKGLISDRERWLPSKNSYLGSASLNLGAARGGYGLTATKLP